ncbi:hypothetical protein HD806DRAFT_234015 [Xylariaceae sp. AK1471]|nr:hypothetical protein HD806DRAFT_234015 [Xylariaceae sp. AK1471]
MLSAHNTLNSLPPSQRFRIAKFHRAALMSHSQQSGIAELADVGQKGESIFVSSTISRDDTRGDASKEHEMLASFAQAGFQRVNNDQAPRPPRISLLSAGPNGPPNPYAAPPPGQASTSWIPPDDYDDDDDDDGGGFESEMFSNIRKAMRSSQKLDDSWPARLMRKYEKDLKITEAEGLNSPTSDVAGHPTSGQNEVTADLTVCLGSFASKALDINVLDKDKASTRYLAFLLDTIEQLSSQVAFLESEASHVKHREKIKETVHEQSDKTLSRESTTKKAPRGHTVHRVFCASRTHNHDAMVYDDLPQVQSKEFHNSAFGDEILCGQQEIRNEVIYLQEHVDISFLIIKEHICTPESKFSNLENRAAEHPLSFSATKYGASSRMERMRIVSPVLQRALQSVAECKPDFVTFGGRKVDEIEMEAPYAFLYHHRKKINDLSKSDPVSGAHIMPLLQFLDIYYGDEYKKADEDIAKGTVTNSTIGFIFKPNQIVVSTKKELPGAYILNEWPLKKQDKLWISCWMWAYNGHKAFRTHTVQSVEASLLDELPIRELKMYPIEYAKRELYDQLESRGKKFWNLRNKQLFAYSGFDAHGDHEYVDEKFMIDVETYTKMHANFHRDFSELDKFDSWPKEVKKDEAMPPRAVLLLPSQIHGYLFREKKWVQLNVSQLHSVTWNKKAFDRLVLNDNSKELLEALISTRASTSGKSKRIIKDFVKEKGNGCTILLHGSPGTGKTLTAESVAELAEKPLYRVTCADMGTDALQMEKYLQTILHLGHHWDCVLLLDEADIFMEERVYADLKNNSLVSVFLRVLEYYEGILILTSNRVDNIDEAFKSRIHFALTYDRLDKDARRKVWSNFLEMFQESEDSKADVNIPQLEAHLDDLAARNINGRQIYNALSTAQQLAMHREEKLGMKHLEQVLKNLERFNKHLNTTKSEALDYYTKGRG